jgi:hypothetical protein
MLSNFETSQQKLLHVILAGQPALAEKLQSASLVQLRQRVSIVANLRACNPRETREYINHRLKVAGYDNQRPLFTEQAMALIARYSEGIPRNINNICFNAMSLGCANKAATIDVVTVQEVLEDLDLNGLFTQSEGGFRFERPRPHLCAFQPEEIGVDANDVSEAEDGGDVSRMPCRAATGTTIEAPSVAAQDVALKPSTSVVPNILSYLRLAVLVIVAWSILQIYPLNLLYTFLEEAKPSPIVRDPVNLAPINWTSAHATGNGNQPRSPDMTQNSGVLL